MPHISGYVIPHSISFACLSPHTLRSPDAHPSSPLLLAQVLDQLARVTVALHRDELRQRMGLPGSGVAVRAGTIPRGATLAPQWHRNDAGSGEGQQQQEPSWAKPPTVSAAADPPYDDHSYSSNTGSTYHRVPAGSHEADPQGQARPLRGPPAPPMGPIIGQATGSQLMLTPQGNVRMPPPLPVALTDRVSPLRLQPNALLAGRGAAEMSVRPGRSPPRERMLPPPASLLRHERKDVQQEGAEDEEDG